MDWQKNFVQQNGVGEHSPKSLIEKLNVMAVANLMKRTKNGHSLVEKIVKLYGLLLADGDKDMARELLKQGAFAVVFSLLQLNDPVESNDLFSTSLELELVKTCQLFFFPLLSEDRHSQHLPSINDPQYLQQFHTLKRQVLRKVTAYIDPENMAYQRTSPQLKESVYLVLQDLLAYTYDAQKQNIVEMLKLNEVVLRVIDDYGSSQPTVGTKEFAAAFQLAQRIIVNDFAEFLEAETDDPAEHAGNLTPGGFLAFFFEHDLFTTLDTISMGA